MSTLAKLLEQKGSENPYLLWQEMGKAMTDNCTVVRYNDRLDATLQQCEGWKDRYNRVQLSDTGMWSNQNLSFTRALRDMILMSEAVLKGARLRDESRGAHFKHQARAGVAQSSERFQPRLLVGGIGGEDHTGRHRVHLREARRG